MSRPLQIAVCGASRTDPELDRVAHDVGRRLAEAGAVVICGGRSGVMEAVAAGAADAGGDVIGILPGDDPAAANPGVTHVVATGVGAARNLAVVASADAVIAIGGAWGTLSEIALARNLGRAVVAIGSWAVEAPEGAGDDLRIERAAGAAEAVELALAAAADRSAAKAHVLDGD